MPVLCEMDGQAEDGDRPLPKRQITRRVMEWIGSSRPQAITTSLVAAQFEVTRETAEYVLRTLSRRNVIAVVEKRPRRDVVYRAQEAG